MSVHLDFWLRELSRAGSPASALQELLRRLASAIDRPAKYFPDSPLAYVERMREPILSTFLPQKGPIVIENAPNMASEVLSRSRAWELAYLELSMLGVERRPVHDLHMMIADVICMMARNDSPWPPRRVGWQSCLRW